MWVSNVVGEEASFIKRVEFYFPDLVFLPFFIITYNMVRPKLMPSSSTAIAAGVTSPTMPSTFNSPCAACKFLRRKCQPDCVLAPHFPPDQPNKFVHVHRVFGASNVTKLLTDLDPFQREDAVNSLAYEAEMRLRDPVYGCVGVIYVLQHQLHQINVDLVRARRELATYRAAATAGATRTTAAAFGQNGNMFTGNGLLVDATNFNDRIRVEEASRFDREQLLSAYAIEMNENSSQNNMMIRRYDADQVASVVNEAYDAEIMAVMMNPSTPILGYEVNNNCYI